MSLYSRGLAVRPSFAFQKQTYRRGIVGVGADDGILGTGIGANVYQEMDSISTEVRTIEKELFAQLPTDLDDPKAIFFRGVWSPFVNEWRIYVNDHMTKFSKFITIMSLWRARAIWKDLQEYRARLGLLYGASLGAGFSLNSPAPTKPRTSTFEDAADYAKDAGSAIWKIVKFLIYAAAIVMGGLVLMYGVKMLQS